MTKRKYPKFELGTYKYWHEEQCYCDGDEGWLVSSLWAAAEGLPTYEVPIIALQTDLAMWDSSDSFMEFLSHVKLINEADLSYPIILSPDGNIADGRHRFGKAILNGHSTIKIKRLIVMPDPDFRMTDEGSEDL